MDFSFSDLNFNSVENLPGFEARVAFTVNSISEIADDPEKPCLVKFTWRYATNRINLQNPKSSDFFTDDFDFVFT